MCLAAVCGQVFAEDEAAATSESSPWILLPTLSNNPKLGTAVGAIAAYARRLDAESKLSILGVTALYTSTDSAILAAFARTSFGGDQHRLNIGIAGGTVKNDYDDYLGTGLPLKSDDNLRAVYGRYLYRLPNDWFVGVQAVKTNYQIVGQTALDEDILGLFGLTGFKSAGAGVVLYHDSRDNLDSPKKGWVFNANNVFYGADDQGNGSFEVYRADYKQFWSHGDGHVLAVRQSNQWTVEAPPSAFAPVTLRGYTMGEYLGKYMSSLELEERHRIAERWTATAFAGVACLYGESKACSNAKDRYPSAGLGVQYVIKPDKGIVANLEFAVGKEGNKALIFKMGYGW